MGTKVLIMLAIILAIDVAAHWFGKRQSGDRHGTY